MDAVVDGQSHSPEAINSGGPQDVVLLPTYFFFLISNDLNITIQKAVEGGKLTHRKEVHR